MYQNHKRRITITRRLEFDAGHTVTRHESKCAHLHGHRYVAEIACSSFELDKIGRVIDFGEVKRLVGTWIDENWDHKFLIFAEDPRRASLELIDKGSIVVVPYNPTAENMSKDLHNTAFRLLQGLDIDVDRLRLYETPNGWADSVVIRD